MPACAAKAGPTGQARSSLQTSLPFCAPWPDITHKWKAQRGLTRWAVWVPTPILRSVPKSSASPDEKEESGCKQPGPSKNEADSRLRMAGKEPAKPELQLQPASHNS